MRPCRRPRRIPPVLLALLVCAPLPGLAEPPKPPPPGALEAAEGSGWLVAGSRPQDYAVELEPEGGRDGTLAASLRTRAEGSPPDGFVTLMRWVPPQDYRGKRLRLSAWIKAEGVEEWSGLWMRIDGPEPEGVLGFDNMRRRPIRGTRDWRRYEVVLDVATEATRVNYGILLHGAGRVWVDDFRLETVGPEVEVTDPTWVTFRGPVNLDFDHPPEPPP